MGNIVVGVLAALVNWGLNGAGGNGHTGTAFWGTFAAATFAGLAGSRFFVYEVEKAVERAADRILEEEGYDPLDERTIGKPPMTPEIREALWRY